MASYFDWVNGGGQDAPAPTPEPNPPNITEFQKRRAALTDELKRLIHEQESPLGDSSEMLRKIREGLPLTDVATEYERSRDNIHSRGGRPVNHRIAEVTSQLLKLEASPEADQLRRMLKRQDQPNIDAIRGQYEKVTQELPFAATDEQRKRMKEQQKLLQGSAESIQRTTQPPQQIQQMQADLKASQEQARGELGLYQMNPQDTPEGIMKANGVPEADYYKGVLDMLQQFQVDRHEPVNFGVGLGRILRDPSMADLAGEFQAFVQSLAGPGPDHIEGKEGELPQKSPLQQEQELRSQDVKELGKLAELQTWGEIISFVLLSMIIGPNLAFLFYSNAAKKGALKNQIKERDTKIEQFQAEEERKADEARWFKRLAAQTAIQRESSAIDDQREFQQRLIMKSLEAVFAAKKNAQTPEQKKYVEALEGKISRAQAKANSKLRLADQARKDFDEDGAKHWVQEAISAFDEVEALTEQLDFVDAGRYTRKAAEPEEEDAGSD